MPLTWKNVNAPSSSSVGTSGSIAAIKGMSDALDKMNIFKTIQQGISDRYDTARAEEQDAFKRESDLLARQLVEQDIAKGQFDASNRQTIFDLDKKLKDAQIAANEQRRMESAYNLGQTKKIQEDTDKLSQAFLERMQDIPEGMTERQIQQGLTNYAAENNLSPQAVNTVFANLKSRYAPTTAEAAITASEAKIQEQANKEAIERLKNEGKISAALIKASGKKESPYIKDSVISNITRSDLDKTFSIETDADTQKLVNDHVYNQLQKYKGSKINQAALDNLISASTIPAGISRDKDFFDSERFDALLQQYINR